MKLDNEMDRLTLEHGTMLGPPTEEERAEESTKKKLTNKVGHWGNSSASINAAWGCSLVRVSFVPPADIDHLVSRAPLVPKAESSQNCGHF